MNTLCEDVVEEVLRFLPKSQLVTLARCNKAWYNTIFSTTFPELPTVSSSAASTSHDAHHFRRHCFTTTSALNAAWVELLKQFGGVVSASEPHVLLQGATSCCEHPNCPDMEEELDALSEVCSDAYDGYGGCGWECHRIPEALHPLLDHHLQTLSSSSATPQIRTIARMFLNFAETSNHVPKELIATTVPSNFEHNKHFPERQMPFEAATRDAFFHYMESNILHGFGSTAPSTTMTAEEFFEKSFDSRGETLWYGVMANYRCSRTMFDFSAVFLWRKHDENSGGNSDRWWLISCPGCTD